MDLDDYLNLLRDNREPERSEVPSADVQPTPTLAASAADDSRKQIECPVHGAYSARWVKLAPGRPPLMGWGQCPRCKVEWDEASRRDLAQLAGYLPGEPNWSRK